MNKRVALASYLMPWAAVAGGFIYGIVRAGYSVWIAVASAFLLFVFVNGSLAYRACAHQLKLEGKVPPPYLQYLFFPRGFPKFNGAAPWATHVFVGAGALLTGVFFVLCGVAPVVDAAWSRISRPLVASAICLIVTSIGVALLYLAWHLFAYRRPPNDVA